jgi:RNA polymerase sigma factor (sigma-70 family)
MTKYKVTDERKNPILFEARKNAKLSIYKVAEKIGISPFSYINFELMKRYPSKETQKKICDFYRSIGIFLLEEDVFSEEVRNRTKKKDLERTDLSPEMVQISDVYRELISVTDSETPETYTTKNLIIEETRRVLSSLTSREEKVLKMRFGIDENYEHTLEEVAQKFDVTRERIRRIEAKALRKFRHSSRKLRSFLED